MYCSEALEAADEKGSAVVDLMYIFDLQGFAPVEPLHKKEGDTVDDQSNGNHNVIVKMFIHPVIQQKADHRGGQHSDDDLEPELPGGFFLLRVLFGRQRVQLVEEQQDHRGNGAQLNDHLKHLIKFRTYPQLNELIQQNHMSGGGYRQPLGNAFHNAKEDRL